MTNRLRVSIFSGSATRCFFTIKGLIPLIRMGHEGAMKEGIRDQQDRIAPWREGLWAAKGCGLSLCMMVLRAMTVHRSHSLCHSGHPGIKAWAGILVLRPRRRCHGRRGVLVICNDLGCGPACGLYPPALALASMRRRWSTGSV